MGKKKKVEQSNYLKIGDTVLLYYNTRGKDGDPRKSGYVMADLSGFSSHQLLLVKPSEKDPPELADIQLGAFRVVAENKYDAQTRYRELNEKLKELDGKDRVEAKLVVQQAKSYIKIEQNENKAKQRQLRGNYLHYGETIQLFHTLTQKYLCVTTVGTSVTESSKLKVYLQRKDSLGCIFRLHPHIKVEAVGDEVNYNDQVKFESLAIEGQFLHSSKKTFSDIKITANSECFELNLAANYSPLQIVPHHPTQTKDVKETSSALRASDIVRFFNRTQNCYIMAEGSFSGSNLESSTRDEEDEVDKVVHKDVHFRRKNISSAQSSTSPNAFWQIEKSSKRSNGDFMLWREECRIKHLPTRRYLAVVGSDDVYKVTLMSSKLDETATEFELFPVVHKQQSDDKIDCDVHVRVKHKKTKTWLHFDKDKKITSEKSKELFQMIASKDINLDDAFALEKVCEEQVSDFNYVASVTEVLSKQVEKCLSHSGGKPHLPIDCHMISTIPSLKHLNILILKKETTMKFKQKLLRSMSTLKLVMRLMTFHIAKEDTAVSRDTAQRRGTIDISECLGDSSDHEGDGDDIVDGGSVILDQEVYTACYAVFLGFLKRKSSKNRDYLSKYFVDIFTDAAWNTELSEGYSIEDVLIEMTKDNSSMLKIVIACVHLLIQKLQNTLKGDDIIERGGVKFIRALIGLSDLCVCKGEPQSEVQDAIFQELKECEVLFFSLLSTKNSLDPTVGITDVTINMDDEPLITSAADSEHVGNDVHKIILFDLSLDNRKDQIHLKILVAQFKLLVMLCKGDNTEVISYLQDDEGIKKKIGVNIDFDFIMKLLEYKYPSEFEASYAELKAALVELMKVMYVEVGGNRPFLEKIPLSFKIHEIGKIPFAASAKVSGDDTGARAINGPSFTSLSGWIKQFFKAHYQTRGRKLNKLPGADEGEKNELIVRVLQLVATLVKYGYYNDEKDIRGLLPLVISVLKTENDYLARSIEESNEDEDSTDINKAFRYDGKYHYREQYSHYYGIKNWAMQILKLLFDFNLYMNLNNLIYDFRWLKEPYKIDSRSISGSMMLNNLNALISLETPVGIKDPKEKHKILSRLMQDQLKLEGCEVAAKERLRDIIHRGIHFELQLTEWLLDIANYESPDLVQNSLLLLDRYYSIENDLFNKALKTHLLTHVSAEFCDDVQKLMSDLKNYLKAGHAGNENGYPVSYSPVKELAASCWLEGEVKGFEPHQINQSIILSFGALSDVLNYVFEHFVDHETILDSLELLRGLACQNLYVQKRIFQDLELFLASSSNSKLTTSIGKLLCEVFSGGPSIALAVSEKQIVHMMNLLFENNKSEGPSVANPAIHSALIELLLVRELDLPLKHNQLIVAKSFSAIREDAGYVCKHLLAEEKRSNRMAILSTRDDDDCDLQNLMMITDLLATCAYGDNEGVDSICCTIFSEDELIEIVTHDAINIYRKRPFMKYLVNVYMSISGDKARKMAKFYTKNKKIRRHISEIAVVLSRASKVMKNMSDRNYLSVKELLIEPSWKVSHNCVDRKHPDSPEVIKIDHDGGREMTYHISDILLYLYESFLPFLQEFYYQTYKYKKDDALKKLASGDFTDEIYTALLTLYQPISSDRVYFGAEIQLKLYHRACFLVQRCINNTMVLSEEMVDIQDEIKMNLLNCSCTIDDTIDCDDDQDDDDDEEHTCFHVKLRSRARKNYNHTYSEEIGLNKSFRQFVLNYRRVYEGKNNKKDQVKGKNVTDGAYSVPGPNYLPLGRSFQHHVKIFNHDWSKKIFKYGNPEKEVKINTKERLLRQLEISLSRRKSKRSILDEEVQTALDIKCLQILRTLIYNKFILIDQEDKEREPERYRKKCESELHPIQDEIQGMGRGDNGTISRVVPLLSYPDERIVNEVLAFLKALLESGNENIQKGFIDLQKSHDNPMFPSLHEMLHRSTLLYRESQQLISQLHDRITSDEEILAEYTDNKSHLGSQNPRSTSHVATRRTVITVKRFMMRNNTIIIEGNHRVHFLNIYRSSDWNEDIDKKSLKTVQFYDLSRVTLISEVIGLMCDGQYKKMQSYLREQKESIKSINMVKELTHILYEFSKRRIITFDTLPLTIEIVKSLLELCSGNYNNCEVIFESRIIGLINYFLQIDITDINFNESASYGLTKGQRKDKKQELIKLRIDGLQLKASVIELLEVMLEDISSESDQLTRKISEGLDISALHFTMVDFYALMDDGDLKRERFEDNAVRALFKSYSIIRHLIYKEVTCQTGRSLVPTEAGVLDAWNYCDDDKNYHCVEIAYKDEDEQEDLVTKVYFNVDLKVEIKDELRDTVKYQVDRSTHGDKMRDFHEWMDAVKRDTLHRDWLERKKLSFIAFLSRKRYWFLILLTVLLNLIVLASYEMPVSQGGVMNNRTIPAVPTIRNEFQITLYALGSLHIFLSLWMVLEYFIVNWPHFVVPEILCSIPLPAVPRVLIHSPITWPERIDIPLLSNFVRTNSSINIFGFATIYVLIFLASSALSLVYFGYFYCLCLLYIVIDNDILQRALQSVTKNGKSLLWVATLLLAILFIYAVISFAIYQEEFNDPENSRFCQHLDECFITVLRFGLIDSFLEFGVKDSISQEARNRFFFDLTFFIVITTIGLNIVFGIIIDTFSELRDARYSAEEDMKSTCFICSLPSHEFDKLANDGFMRHTKHDHNMWSYIYYSIYLDQVDTSNHNAIEKYVYGKIKSKSVDYIPFGRALVLKKKDDSEELKKELKDLHKTIQERFDELNKRLSKLKAK